MKDRYVGSEIVLTLKSGKDFVGTLKKVNDADIVLQNGDAYRAVFKDCVASWRLADSSNIEDDVPMFVLRCSRETPKCPGRVGFTDDNENTAKEAVVCEKFDKKKCAVVRFDFNSLKTTTRLELLKQCMIDNRTEERRSEKRTRRAKKTTK